MDFIDFQLRAWLAARDRVEVMVHSSPAGEMRRPHAVRADLRAVRAPVERLRGVVTACARGEGPTPEAHQAEILALGQTLSALLLPPPVSVLLRRSLDRVPRADGVRLRLCLDDPLVDLPWELLRDPDETDAASPAGFIALHERISLVRGASTSSRVLRPSRRRQRLAFAGALHGRRSREEDRFGVRGEHAALADALKPLEKLIAVGPFVDSSGDNVRTVLAKPALIFHYSGHAEVLREQGHILKEAVAGNIDNLRVASLVPMLQRAGTRLVVLNACNSGFWPIARPLLEADLDLAAVIGIQGEVEVRPAHKFCQTLYEALALGLSLDESVTWARHRLLEDVPPGEHGEPWLAYAWSSFMVYMPTTDVTLFPKPTDPELKVREQEARSQRAQTIVNVHVDTMVGGTVSGIASDRSAGEPARAPRRRSTGEHLGDGRGNGSRAARRGERAREPDGGDPRVISESTTPASADATNAAPRTGAGREYIDLNLELRDLDPAAGTFTVAVLPSAKVGESRPVAVPLGLDQLEKDLARLADKKLSAPKLMALGERLGDRLLPPGEVRDLFRAALRKAGRDRGVRLRLLIRDARLAQLPWEYCYLQDGGAEKHRSNFLLLNPLVSMVRHEAMPEEHPALATADPSRLRLVVATASVTSASIPGLGEFEFDELDLDVEREAIEEAVRDLMVDGVTVDAERTLVGATAQALNRALASGADLFHFAGHGLFAEGAADPAAPASAAAGYIILSAEPGSTEGTALSADDLAMSLQRAGVRVAVLGACESGRRDGQSPWSGVAPTLVRRGLPAVVSMQYEVLDEPAAAFSRMFYTSLAAGLTLDEAVSAGRQAMLGAESGGAGEWGVPVLYMRSRDGVVFPRFAERASPTRDRLRVVIDQVIGTVEAGGEVIGIVGQPTDGSFHVKTKVDTVRGTVVGMDARSSRRGG